MELTGYFKGMLGRIEPDPTHVRDAKKAHEELRKRIREHEDVMEAHKETYLAGSYARHTAIKNIKDVDVICVVDINKDVTEPIVTLRWLEGAMLDHYDDVRLQGRSIGITTADGFCLDLVPGTPLSAEDGPLWIPDREAKAWVLSHPKGQIAFSTKRNASTGGFHVQTVKIMKLWRDRLSSALARPKSYVLEALVAETMSPSPPYHAEAVVSVLEGVSSRYRIWVGTGTVPTIPDPGYPGVNVAKRWEAAEFDAFIGRVESAATTARAALQETDEGKSAAAWRRLFGEEFAPGD